MWLWNMSPSPETTAFAVFFLFNLRMGFCLTATLLGVSWTPQKHAGRSKVGVEGSPRQIQTFLTGCRHLQGMGDILMSCSAPCQYREETSAEWLGDAGRQCCGITPEGLHQWTYCKSWQSSDQITNWVYEKAKAKLMYSEVKRSSCDLDVF